MWRWVFVVAPLMLTGSCGPHVPPPEAPAAVVPNLPIINPARPVTEESLSTLEAEFHRAALETVASYVDPAESDEPPVLTVRVIRLFSREKVLWVEARLGPWWDTLEAPRQDEFLASLGRQLYAIDERAFNQKRDVILTAKDLAGRRLGDATVTPFSTHVRLAAGPAAAAPPQATSPSATPR